MSEAEETSQPEEVEESDNNLTQGMMLVGIGASAGGVEALRRFFEKMPSDSGLAFVVIVHLAPNYFSSLAEMLQVCTRMPVRQVKATMKVEPNHVYVIPPEKNLVMVDGHIDLIERETEISRQVPVDLFFRTLASSYQHRALAVVLSGAGTDGSVGVKLIKEAGGIAIAQDPSEAEYEGMPRSAIESGGVDFILPVQAIPDKLIALKENAQRIKLPPLKTRTSKASEEELSEVLKLLRARTRHDFSNYKRSTLLRRIERRLQVTESEDIPAYLNFVRNHPEELQGLLRDLLINVTNFFRDPETFQALNEKVIPRLFADKSEGEQVRVWVTGCATGEEAFSLAMLLLEHADLLSSPPTIQIFATDIDEEAIGSARLGLYPDTIAADVSPERLKRFFIKEGLYYRIRREVREMVLFAPHNILRDPPFSKLDLISCRNLLIYINRQTQDRVLEIFEFALKPGGYLFLGSSESADQMHLLFKPVDKKRRIYQSKREGGAMGLPITPALPQGGPWEARTTGASLALPSQSEEFTFGELHYRMLEALAPPSVLVNSDYDIVHLSDSAGRYLWFAGGEPSRDLLKVAHPDLRLELRSLLLSATLGIGQSQRSAVPVKLNGETHVVHISVRPVVAPNAVPRFLLVLFEEDKKPMSQTSVERQPSSPPPAEINEVVRGLEDELERTKLQLRANIEEYETSTEELRAANEELQAMNEEMRSAAEELETSKEELQSVNEELTTVNQELKEKIDENARTTSDLQNLMASTEIGTLFLDRNLRIKRYTPSITDLFNIIPTDEGRPIGDLTHKLAYDNLAEDAEQVLRRLHTIEREVTTTDNRWFIMRLLPFRTIEDKINGVVLTFVDITERKQAEERLHESQLSLEAALTTARMATWTWTPETDTIVTSKSASEVFGLLPGETLNSSDQWLKLLHPEDRERYRALLLKAGETGESWHTEFRIIRPHSGQLVWLEERARTTRDPATGRATIFGLVWDITERKLSDERLRWSEERLRSIVDSVVEYAIIIMDEEGRIEFWNNGAERMFGYTAEEIKGQSSEIIYTPEDVSRGVPRAERERARAEGRALDERWHMRKDGTRFYVSGVLSSSGESAPVGFVKIARDLTREREATDELRRSREQMDAIVQERTRELASANEALRHEAEEHSRVERERLRLLRRIVSTQEEERRRIARELHDQMGQRMTALRLQLEAVARQHAKHAELRSQLEQLQELAFRLDSDVDYLAWELRPAVLDDLGLTAALTNFAQEWSKHFGVKADFHTTNLADVRLSQSVETNLYRIAQEALNNVSKHASADNVDIILERRDGNVVLIIEDNGRGFEPASAGSKPNAKGMGLYGMRERAGLIGGTVEIESTPGEGTTVFVRVPLEANAGDLSEEGED